MYTKLRNAKIGVGPKTIILLEKAGLKTAKEMIEAGLKGIIDAGIQESVAVQIMEIALANQTDANPNDAVIETVVKDDGNDGTQIDNSAKVTEPVVKTEKQVGGLGAKLMGAGIDRNALPLTAPAKPEPRPAPTTKAQKPGFKAEGTKGDATSKILDLGLTETVLFTSPVEIRPLFDRLPGGLVPATAMDIRHFYPKCRLCHDGAKPASIDDTMVLVMTTTKEGTNPKVSSTCVCKTHSEIAKAGAILFAKQRQQAEKALMVMVELIPLRKAWENLTNAWNRQIAERNSAATRKRLADEKAQKLSAEHEEIRSALESTIAVLDDKDGWMTQAELASFASPTEIHVFDMGLEGDRARELGVLPSTQQTEAFGRAWDIAMAHYLVFLAKKPPKTPAEHEKLIQELRARLVEKRLAIPMLPIVTLARWFKHPTHEAQSEWRYLVVTGRYSSLIMKAHTERTGFKFEVPFPTIWEYLGHRLDVDFNGVMGQATAAFARTEEGKKLAAFVAFQDFDAEANADALLLTGRVDK